MFLCKNHSLGIPGLGALGDRQTLPGATLDGPRMGWGLRANELLGALSVGAAGPRLDLNVGAVSQGLLGLPRGAGDKGQSQEARGIKGGPATTFTMQSSVTAASKFPLSAYTVLNWVFWYLQTRAFRGYILHTFLTMCPPPPSPPTTLWAHQEQAFSFSHLTIPGAWDSIKISFHFLNKQNDCDSRW